MKSKFITDAQDAWDGFLDTFGAEFYGSFSYAAETYKAVEESAASVPVEIPSTPALTSEAVESLGAQSGPTTAVVMTTGGITINLLFDAGAMAAPASFRAGIQQAASLLTAAIFRAAISAPYGEIKLNTGRLEWAWRTTDYVGTGCKPRARYRRLFDIRSS